MLSLQDLGTYWEDMTGDSKKRKVFIGACTCTALTIASYSIYKFLLNPSRFKYNHYYTHDTNDDKPDYSQINKKWITNPWETRQIPMSKSGPGAWKPVTIFEAINKMLKNKANSPLYIQQRKNKNNDWIDDIFTCKQYYNKCIEFASSLISIGINQYDGVCMIGFNSIEMVIIHLGTIFAGGIISGLYTTSNPGQCQYIINHMKAKVIFVENEMQLNKFLSIKSELQHTTHIIIWNCSQNDKCIINANKNNNKIKVMHWNEFMSLAKNNSE
eukprot:157994_1